MTTRNLRSEISATRHLVERWLDLAQEDGISMMVKLHRYDAVNTYHQLLKLLEADLAVELEYEKQFQPELL